MAVRRPDSLRRKLVAAIMSTISLVLVLIAIVFTVYEYVTVREWLVRHLTTRAAVLAANVSGSIAFQNPDDGRRVLEGLQVDRSITAAAIYDMQGQVFAFWPDTLRPEMLPAPMREGHRFRPGALEAFTPVREDRLWLGTLYLRSDLRALDERLRIVLIVMLGAIAASIVLGFVLSDMIQRRIIGPVLKLAGTARDVSTRQDYAARADVGSDDELGVLAADFNAMLDQIQRRDAALMDSEAHQRAILESALDAVVTIDGAGRIVEFNPAAERLFDLPRQQALGRDLPEMALPAGRHPRLLRRIREELADGTDRLLRGRFELTGRRADGTELPLEVAVTRIPRPGPPLYTAFIRDVTDRKRAEQEILDLNEGLERRVAERTAELESFSYSVSHDLRAPLRAIDGFSKALMDEQGGAISPASQRHLERVRAAVRNMGQIIDGLLNLSRLSRTPLRMTPVDLSAMAHEIAQGLAQAQPERDVTFSIADGLVVEGDSGLLRVVMDNLIANAWKFTSRQPKARIEVGRLARDVHPTFFVRDDGAGFDMAHAGLLFAPFQRLHRQDEFEGTGVGLATVQRIVQRHHGRLWAESAVGRGATIYFRLWERTARG
jgi:PAS domain S-box-containing protein